MGFVVDDNHHADRWEWSTSSDHIFMRLQASDLVLNKCVDVWFGWRTSDDRHYDNRHIRNCKSYGERENTRNGHYEPNTARELVGVNRMGICMCLQEHSTFGQCENRPGVRFSVRDVDPDIPTPATRSWVRYQTDPSTSLVATIRQVCLSEGEKPMTATNEGCRRSRLTAVLISVAVATLALSSCAETERPQLSASAQDASERLVALNSRIMGNEVERSAGSLVAFHQLQSRVADCMLERGHVYTPPRFVNYWEGLATQPNHGATSLLDPLDNDLGIAVQKSSPAVLYFARNGLVGSDEVKSRAYEDALDHCGQLGGGGSSDAPAAALRLRTDLDIWIEETTGGIGYEHAPYRSCMAEQDFDVVNNAELYEYVAARFPSPLESPAGGTGTEDWQAAVQLEQRAAAADATCRADIVDSGLQLVAADLEDWIAAHESDLGQLDASWTALVREAQSLPQWPRVERTLIMNQSAEPPSS